eukprot:gnl/TRDRNA2_/TRDRNA2_209216_c0_seq1.p1 gnl/TRDRNA2_/TRDRNA2_209216_c0~~gnl/TRDRNA2_/TRDRNA2_209216_c0_seq1.p1  ORF type:complete len:232 (+),score=32.56 gnl/TRDRNA2_/TRDRNA2_209216_c0_seq1:150-845(+)
MWDAMMQAASGKVEASAKKNTPQVAVRHHTVWERVVQDAIEKAKEWSTAAKSKVLQATAASTMTEKGADRSNSTNARSVNRARMTSYESFHNDWAYPVVVTFRSIEPKGTIARFLLKPNATTWAKEFPLDFKHEVCVSYSFPICQMHPNATACKETRSPDQAGYRRIINVSEVIGPVAASELSATEAHDNLLECLIPCVCLASSLLFVTIALRKFNGLQKPMATSLICSVS